MSASDILMASGINFYSQLVKSQIQSMISDITNSEVTSLIQINDNSILV